MLVGPLNILCAILSFYLFKKEKDLKMKNSKKEDFNQQTGCKASVHWWKYTTLNNSNMLQVVLRKVWKSVLMHA